MSNVVNDSSNIIKQILNYGEVLQSERTISYLDFVEQLTYILFLKMNYEYSQLQFKKNVTIIPNHLNWITLTSREGTDLELQYTTILSELAHYEGIIGIIFRKAHNNIREPAKLKRLIYLINQIIWIGEITSLKELYTNVLNYSITEIEDILGQYFPPSSLIKSIMSVLNFQPNKYICDPCCGIGDLAIAAYEFISNNYQLNKDEKKFLKFDCFKGWINNDIIAKFCAMNLYLHGIGGYKSSIVIDDVLISSPEEKFDFVLVNPPFGKRKKIIIDEIKKNESLVYEREDFTSTSSIHLNFLQHVKSILRINGKGAIFVPDNILFEGGKGEKIRKKLLHECDVHTLLRLPTGIFYAQGVKANVLFFDKKPASDRHWTDRLWIYDFRTNKHFTLKTGTLKYEDLQDFIQCYNPENRHRRNETERFKSFTYDELLKRDKVNLDIFWLRDESLEESDNLPAPNIIAQEIVENLEAALEEFSEIEESLTINK